MIDYSNILNFGASNATGAEYKACLLKKNIISYFAKVHEATIADLSRELNVSVPTVTKLVTELREEGYLTDYGKIETAGGRRPNVFGLSADAGYFVGVDARRRLLNFVLINFKGELVTEHSVPNFHLENTVETLDFVLDSTNDFINQADVERSKVIGLGLSLTGRINSQQGSSYTYLNFEKKPLAKVFEDRLGIPTYVENDSRAMLYAEKCFGVVENEHDVLLLNIGRGVGVGMLLDDKLYYGKSGFAGEFGHIPLFENELMCHCGKKGCVETEASGAALEQMFANRVRHGETSLLSPKFEQTGAVNLFDIIDAANRDDVLSITLIAELAEKMGRGIGVLINLLNPDLVVVGGTMSEVGDYLMLPLKSAINKYSLSLVSKDTDFKLSSLGDSASVKGVAMLMRAHVLEVI